MDDFLAVKFTSDGSTDTVEGWLAPYGGPDYLDGKDWFGDFFSAKTDFALEWFGEWQRPLLYQHGLDDTLKTEVVGRIKVERRDKGLWMQAQLDAAHQYHDEIAAMVAEGALGASSGSVAHLVERDRKTGEIRRWPLIEGSLTPTPANPQATVGYAVKSADAVAHLMVIGSEPPEDIAEPVSVDDVAPVPVIEPPAAKAGARNSASDMQHIQSAHDAMVALGAACSPAMEARSGAAPVEPEPAAMTLMVVKGAEPTANAAETEALRELLRSHAIKVARDILRT